MPQGRKRAGPFVIVLKHQPLSANLLKNWPGNQIVTTCYQPTAALIPAAQVKAKRHLRKPLHQRIFHFDAPTEPLVESPTLLLIERSGSGVKHRGVMRRIDLDVCRSQSY